MLKIVIALLLVSLYIAEGLRCYTCATPDAATVLGAQMLHPPPNATVDCADSFLPSSINVTTCQEKDVCFKLWSVVINGTANETQWVRGCWKNIMASEPITGICDKGELHDDAKREEYVCLCEDKDYCNGDSAGSRVKNFGVFTFIIAVVTILFKFQ